MQKNTESTAAKKTRTPISKETTKESNGNKKHIKPFYVMVIVLLLIVNLFTGYVTYGVMTIWCMKLPVTATDFASSYTYYKPGQVGYGPNVFAQYYCSEEDALKAGFRPSPWQK